MARALHSVLVTQTYSGQGFQLRSSSRVAACVVVSDTQKKTLICRNADAWRYLPIRASWNGKLKRPRCTKTLCSVITMEGERPLQKASYCVTYVLACRLSLWCSSPSSRQ